jgi:DNA-directed RNA polymerase specialized sigma24 family protein
MVGGRHGGDFNVPGEYLGRGPDGVPPDQDSSSSERESYARRDPGSVTRWIDGLKLGDQDAAQALWERYFSRLVRLARARMARCTGADEDEEDAALSAFDSFCAGAVRGRFPRLADRDDLWRLLVVITARKVSAQVDRRRAQKRGGRWLRVDRGVAAGANEPSEDDRLADLVGREPTPEFATMIAEELQILLDRLGDDQLRRIALERMEGYTSDEIAERLGCARRTVARRLDLIRQLWSSEPSP